jgi:hypothetical protein
MTIAQMLLLSAPLTIATLDMISLHLRPRAVPAPFQELVESTNDQFDKVEIEEISEGSLVWCR